MNKSFSFQKSIGPISVAVIAALVLVACAPTNPLMGPLTGLVETQPMTNEIAGEYAKYAMMSANAYHDKNGFVFPLEELGWQLVDSAGMPTDKATFEDPVSGLAYDFYEKRSSNEVVIAFRGTDGWKDWYSNIPTLVPFYSGIVGLIKNQYPLASKIYKNYLSNYPKKKIIALTGHSLGGGLALHISFDYGVKAVTFDTSPNTNNFLCQMQTDAERNIIYQNGELLHYFRIGFPCLYKNVPLKNRYRTEFDFSQSEKFGVKQVKLHNSGPLAMGLLQMAAKTDSELEKFCDKLQCERDPLTVTAQARQPPLEKRLHEQHNWNKNDAHKMDDLVTDLNVFDQIALAAHHTSAKDITLPDQGEDKPTACRLASNDKGTPPSGWDELLAELKEKGAFTELARTGADRSLPLDENQRKQAWELLVTGRAKQDTRQSLFALLENLRKINPDTLKKTVTNGTNPFSLIDALAKDAKSLQAIQKGQPPVVLRNTLHTLQSEPLGEIVSDSAKIFTSQDNPTMRLAIIAYARMNGVNLTEENLNDLNKALDPNQPDLYPFLAGALNTLKQEYGVNDSQRAIEHLKNREHACEGDVSTVQRDTDRKS